MRSWTLALLFAAAAASAAEAPREMHGKGDGFASPGVAIAWAIERGATEAAANVVVRVATDPKTYPWMSVTGVDPFTQKKEIEQQATMVPNMLDVRVPRARFADFPNTEFRFYTAEAEARGGAPPALVVFYHGVPDTAPEFTSDVALDTYLIKRILELR